MYANIVPPLDRTLGALSNILSKAEAHATERKIAPAVLLTSRLYPDMFDLTKQVQLACDFAARSAARLAGEEPKGFPDSETTFAELQSRISATRAYMAGFKRDRYDAAADRDVTLKMRGEDVTMKGLAYLTVYSLPQFYFHVTTAYNILRHNGVEIGKGDFMGA